MTLVTLPSPIHWPGILGNSGGLPSVGNAFTVTSANPYVAYIFCAKENMVVSHVMFRAANVTTSGVATCTVGIEALDATGIPSGSAGFGSTNATTAAITTSTTVLTALGSSATIAKGQLFSVKIAYASSTSVTISQLSNVGHLFQTSLPYYVTNTAGTPTKIVMNSTTACIGLGSSSTTFYQIPGSIPMTGVTGGLFNNTNAAKRGMRFTPPMNCRVIGMRWHNSNASGDFNVAIYDDTTGTAVELSNSSTAFDGDSNSGSTNGTITVYFDNPVTLTRATTYRAALEPSSATNVDFRALTLPSTDYRSASPAGTMAHYTTFATGGWVDTATDTIPFMDIIIDQIDDGAGTGGGGGGGQRVIGG